MTNHAPHLANIKRPLRRTAHYGGNLILLIATAAMLIGFMGMSLYGGLQIFLEGELQRITSNAAMAGASTYYSTTGVGGKPTANPTYAKAVAQNTLATLVNNNSLSGFNTTMVGGGPTHNDANDSVTLQTKSTFPTPFLRIIGINDIEATATATARALRYEPTQFTGPVTILPTGGNVGSYSKIVELAFPLVDGPGNDLYIEQDVADQQGYIVEACNNTECYNLVPGATPIGTSQIRTVSGIQTIYGTAIIDLAKANVRKGSKLRFTHNNQFDSYNAGVPNPPMAAPTPLVIQRIMLFGYSGACVDKDNCPIPAGFLPVE